MPCAEHVLALMLSGARSLPQAQQNQLGAHDWPQTSLRADSRLLWRSEVVLLGFGKIAERLVQLLAPFEVRVTAVRRNVAADAATRTLTLDAAIASGALASADHVVNLLPDDPSTRGLVGEALLSLLKPEATFYNIGRGTTVDQAALSARLTTGRLRAAFLDVTDPEPLPAESPLWTTPRCFITPHLAGGHDTEFERLLGHFVENLRRFEKGEELLDRIR
jgi:phosphoglycerate dehydrogenase-like enzyme